LRALPSFADLEAEQALYIVRPWYERRAERLSADQALVADHYPSLQFRIDREKQKVSLEGEYDHPS